MKWPKNLLCFVPKFYKPPFFSFRCLLANYLTTITMPSSLQPLRALVEFHCSFYLTRAIQKWMLPDKQRRIVKFHLPEKKIRSYHDEALVRRFLIHQRYRFRFVGMGRRWGRRVMKRWPRNVILVSFYRSSLFTGRKRDRRSIRAVKWWIHITHRDVPLFPARPPGQTNGSGGSGVSQLIMVLPWRSTANAMPIWR